MDILASVTETEVSKEGTTAIGALYIRVKNTGGKDALFNGYAMPPGEEREYPFIGKGYAAMPYSADGTTLLIKTII